MKNKKRFSKLAALVLAMTMLACSFSIVSAHEIPSTNSPSLLRGALCPDCGIGQMILRYGSWQYNGTTTQKCIHYPKGEDKMRKEKRSTYWECSNCPMSQSGSDQHRVVLDTCHGFR